MDQSKIESFFKTVAISHSPPPAELYGLNQAQKAAFDAIIAGKSIFLTGPGGTGKSFLLENLHAYYKPRDKKKLAITAMTG